jgi:NAD(P)-dependent dehydrogenase (short-subunit alcohol dehydrogenase family)/uncharacterized protein YndB with AHSA1/START domain
MRVHYADGAAALQAAGDRCGRIRWRFGGNRPNAAANRLAAAQHHVLMTARELDGRVVVVTGGGRGIGRAIAIAAAAAGARVAVVSRSRHELDETVREISLRGGDSRAFPASVVDAVSIASAVDRIVSCYGAVDVLVNNAGTLGPFGPFAENDGDDWWACVEVNLRGPAVCTRAVLPAMLERRAGRIVNVASGGAATAMTYFSSYIVAKTAMVRFTECVATEVRPYGLSVFAIGPGTVRTAMAEHSLTSPQGARWLPWFRRIFEEGFDVPAEVPAALVAALATGRYDALSGRFLTVADDLERLLRSTGPIDREQLYALRINRLPAPENAAARSITDAATSPSGTTLTVDRVLPLSLDEAFAVWLDPAAIAKWFIHDADVNWVTPPHVDCRPGGGFRFHVAGIRGAFEFVGQYREITQGRRLEFTWRWRSLPMLDGPGDTTVVVDFEQVDGTRVTLVQRHLPHQEAVDAHRRGWERCFDGMATLRG